MRYVTDHHEPLSPKVSYIEHHKPISPRVSYEEHHTFTPPNVHYVYVTHNDEREVLSPDIPSSIRYDYHNTVHEPTDYVKYEEPHHTYTTHTTSPSLRHHYEEPTTTHTYKPVHSPVHSPTRYESPTRNITLFAMIDPLIG